MPAEIHIFSGFLGAGKTTLIQKLLKEEFIGQKVVLIENDFGEISIDAALLKTGGVEVKEMNSGCICCSLSGDFVKALKELIERFHPETILIEPSGVGKLSDIVAACSDPRILPLARVRSKTTVVDVKRCKTYLDNFGEFFEDQIQNADIVLLSRTEDFPERVESACRLIQRLNGNSRILVKPWHEITAGDILCANRSSGIPVGSHTCDGDGHDHCGCDHAADEVFDTVTIRTDRVFSEQELKKRITEMEAEAGGTILRAKGIVHSPMGFINLQYLPGDIRITRCDAVGDSLCFIGQNLNRQELLRLFNGT